MKIRIGIGLGTKSKVNDPTVLGNLINALEDLGYDSIWFSERVSGSGLDPIVAMSWAAARTEKLKFGPSVMVVPGRNPVLLAKSIASLDQISKGRVLPAFGLGAVDLGEHQAFGVNRGDRSPWFNEALPLIRRLWVEDKVSHDGKRFHLDNVQVRPKPYQEPMDIWLGGLAPSELRRIGTLGDGWLPSFCTPDDVAAGIPVIDEHSRKVGRPIIDREHFGVLLVYTVDGTLPEQILQAVQRRRPKIEANEIVVQGRGGLANRIKEFIDAGASKFVLMPLTEPEDWKNELDCLAEEALYLQD